MNISTANVICDSIGEHSPRLTTFMTYYPRFTHANVNLLLDPFLPVRVLATSCEPSLLNFFGLRLDEAADPMIRTLAEAMWAAWNESTPTKVMPGGWHLPFIDDEIVGRLYDIGANHDHVQSMIKVSVARCARLSYMSYETQKRSTIEEDLALYERLVGVHPIHVNQTEHQATPDYWINISKVARPLPGGGVEITDSDPPVYRWCEPELHGNLPGWIQYRKTLPGEAVAPLPER